LSVFTETKKQETARIVSARNISQKVLSMKEKEKMAAVSDFIDGDVQESDERTPQGLLHFIAFEVTLLMCLGSIPFLELQAQKSKDDFSQTSVVEQNNIMLEDARGFSFLTFSTTNLNHLYVFTVNQPQKQRKCNPGFDLGSVIRSTIEDLNPETEGI